MNAKAHYFNKVVCVTGAGGSIGSEICRKLIEFEVSKLIMVGHSEKALYDIHRELAPKAPAGALVQVLGSISDKQLMMNTLSGVDIVVHAAAHKHVPMCEENPLAAIENNVGGTINLAHAASAQRVDQFVMISSDKAVKPASVMGATKRVCELFVRFFAARSTTKFTTVRFGNVLGSSGSVIPLWEEQIRKGGPITITDKRCTRFFMTIPDAAELALSAAALNRPDELFVLDMGKPVNMFDMAVWLIANRAIEIKETGLRPGEKIHEELDYGGTRVQTKVPRVLRVKENDSGRLTRWGDFEDLLMATRCRARTMALEKLWEICS